MRPWRARHLPDVIGDYPLEVGLTVWGFFVGAVTLLNVPPSAALATLPHGLDSAWAVAMLAGSITTFWGLLQRHTRLVIARAMTLFAVTFAVYGIAVVSVTGWQRGGASGGLLLVMAWVCWARARRLRETFVLLVKEYDRAHTGQIEVIKDEVAKDEPTGDDR